ncbi:MAG TPA: S-layer homology domain-containing protein [Candidatus Agathobaculum intestinipullorum]|nr:S-layer homology domain-containing protein [Candidatus Agathobaculum intestinipullorum]
MKKLHLPRIGKSIGCIMLAGCLLCGSTVPAYAAAPAYGSVALARAVRPAETGEYLYQQLPDDEKAIYDAIVAQIEELTKDAMDPSGVQVTIPKDSAYSITAKPIFAVFRDHPEFFWVNSSELVWAEGNPNIDENSDAVYVLSLKSQDKSFFYEGFTTDNLQKYRDDFAAKVEEIMREMPPTALDELAKLKYLNDWIALHNVYNANGVGATNFSRCAASGLLSDNDASTPEDDPVCYGYATAMKVLLDALGIENAYIEGWARNGNNGSGEQHAWNYVKLDDGTSTGQEQWYALDPTWDDPSVVSHPARQVYFLVGSNTVTDKNLSGYETFGKNHDPSQSPASKYGFTYPTLALDARDPSASGDVMLQKQDGDTTAYATLGEAMQAAASGDKLILQNSITLDSTVTLKDGVTLDLNGQTGQNSLSPTAITSTVSPVLQIDAGSSASIINSGAFTAVKTSATSVTVVNNQGTLTLGTNLQFIGGTPPMGSSTAIAGNAPTLSPHTRYYVNSQYATAYRVAEPQAPAAGSFPAQDGMTVQNLLDGKPQPTVTMKFYGNTGEPADVPTGEYSLQWTLTQSPNGGSAIQSTDPLENGTYRFEAQAFDYTIPYEVEVSGLPATAQEVSTVALTGLDTPVTGQPLDTAVTVETTGVTASSVAWEPGGSTTAAYDTAYTAVLTLTAETDYAFASSVSVTINGQSAQVEPQPDDTLSVRMAFPATSLQPIYLESIIPPTPITVKNGTALEALPLPGQVEIKTSDGQTRKADVTWTRSPVDGTSYRPELATAQTFRLGGTVALPGGVDANGKPLTVKIDVTVAAASAVAQTAAPTAKPAPGRYKENQTVTLTSATPNAVIYYTLDGSNPSAVNGTRYTAPIAVRGTEGKTVNTRIKAVAVTAGLTDSAVVTFDYDIALPSTSGGGSGSDSSGSVSQPSTSGGTSTVTMEYNSSTSGSTASTTVSSSTMKTAVDRALNAAKKYNTDPVLEINVDVSSRADSMKVTLPSSSLEKLGEHDDAALVILSDVAEITLDSEAISAVAWQAGSTVTLYVTSVPTSELNSRQRAAAGSAPVFELSFKSGNTTISDFDGGRATITLPYRLKSGQKADGIVVWYMDNNGNLSACDTTYNTSRREVTFVTRHFSKYVIGYEEQEPVWSNPYYDVYRSAWYYDAVQYVTQKGLMNGTEAARFSPDETTSRAMIVTILWRQAGRPSVGSTTNFRDVDPSQWYGSAVRWAAANRIVTGYGDGTFGPDDTITREQMAAILYRYAQYKGYSVSATGNLGGYTDANRISSYAMAAFRWICGRGIMEGTTPTTLSPTGSATRAEVATILMRFCDEYNL